MLAIQITVGLIGLYMFVSLITHWWLIRQNEITARRVNNYKILVDGGPQMAKILVLGDPNASDEEALKAHRELIILCDLYRQAIMTAEDVFRFSVVWPIYWAAYVRVVLFDKEKIQERIDNEL